MIYKILIAILLANILSAAYAINNPAASSTLATKFLSANGITYSASNSVDLYQYCFKNSIWIVPPETLLAYLYDNGNVAPVSDQTVWVISNYNQGYFSGKSYTAIDNSTLSQKYLI